MIPAPRAAPQRPESCPPVETEESALGASRAPGALQIWGSHAGRGAAGGPASI